MWAIEIINFQLSNSIFVSFNIPYFLLNCNFIKRWQRPYWVISGLLNGFDIFFLNKETGATSNIILADILLIVIGAHHTKLRILSIQILNLQRYVRVQLLIWIVCIWMPLHWKSAWSYDGVSNLCISILW